MKTRIRPRLRLILKRLIENVFFYVMLFREIFSSNNFMRKFPEHSVKIIMYIICKWLCGRVFANGPGDWNSMSCRVIPKTQKVILDISLLYTQRYKVGFKGKVEQSRERSRALPYTSV